MSAVRETAYAKLNLALHVRGRRPDGRHEIETVFAFCEDGDLLTAEPHPSFVLETEGEFAGAIGGDNLVESAWKAVCASTGVERGLRFRLDKRLPVGAGLGGGSADAAAALRLMMQMWRLDPAVAAGIAGELGSDVPACLQSLPARGTGAGDRLETVDADGMRHRPVLLVNPRVQLSTAEVFAIWDGVDGGPLGDWREGRNDLEEPAARKVPEIRTILGWLDSRPGAELVRMSGSGASCFALFETEEAKDAAAAAVPREWWHLPTRLR